MARVTLHDSRWVDLRPMWVSDKVAIVELDRDRDESALLDYMSRLAGILERGVLARSWEGSLLDMTEMALLGLVRDWAVITDQDALPEANGTSSGTP